MRLIAIVETRDGCELQLDRLDGVVSFRLRESDHHVSLSFEVELAELQAALDALAGRNSARAEPAKDAEAQARHDAAVAQWVSKRVAETEAYLARLATEDEAAEKAQAALAREQKRKAALDLMARRAAERETAPPEPEPLQPVNLGLSPDAERQIRETMGAAPFRPVNPDGSRWSPRHQMRAKPAKQPVSAIRPKIVSSRPAPEGNVAFDLTGETLVSFMEDEA